MTIFPDWRQIGAAMRWARANGFTVKRTRYGRPHVFPDGSKNIYICHQWSKGDRTRITVGSYVGRTDPDITIVNGSARHDSEPGSAQEALEALAVCGVIPVELMEAAR